MVSLSKSKFLNSIEFNMPADLEKAVLGADADQDVLGIVPSGLDKSFCSGYYINNFAEA